MSEIDYRFVLRRGLAATWAAKNEVLLEGEYGLERDTKKLKIGPGAWNSLDYLDKSLALSLLGDVDADDRDDGKSLIWDESAGKHVYKFGVDAVAGPGINIDKSDPLAPVFSATAGSWGNQASIYAAIMALSPKAYWPCQEAAGATALVDASGGGYNLTLKGTNELGRLAPISGMTALYSPSSTTSANGATGAHTCGIAVPWNGDISFMGFLFPINNSTDIVFSIEASGETLATNVQFMFNFTANNQSMFNQLLWEFGAGTDQTVNGLWAPYNVFSLYTIVKKASTKTISCYLNGTKIVTGTYVNEPAGGTSAFTCLHTSSSSQAQASTLGSNYAVFNKALSDSDVMSVAKAAGLAT